VGGIVGGVGGVIIIAVVFWVWWRRRRDSTEVAPAESSFPQQRVALEKYSIAIPPRSELEPQNFFNKEDATTQLASPHGVSELAG
jgi:hypothetical protein